MAMAAATTATKPVFILLSIIRVTAFLLRIF